MKINIMFFLLLLYSCSTIKQIDNNTIFGRWCATDEYSDYPHLTFNHIEHDKYMIFDCKIDTIFGYKYSFQKNYLLIKPSNKSNSKIRIIKLTKDSLILDGLLEYTIPQIYYRCDK
ncbi:hypothetical protein FACS189429_1710 [Bacteroidia bacterium]|nr:hypothetical protein FACS189429_1710 [Bacteroidia bacterium]